MKSDKKPAFEHRLNHIRVTCWENRSTEGRQWFNTSVTRRYRDGEEWKESTTFNGLADLTLVAECIRLAMEFVRRAEASEPESGVDTGF